MSGISDISHKFEEECDFQASWMQHISDIQYHKSEPKLLLLYIQIQWNISTVKFTVGASNWSQQPALLVNKYSCACAGLNIMRKSRFVDGVT